MRRTLAHIPFRTLNNFLFFSVDGGPAFTFSIPLDCLDGIVILGKPPSTHVASIPPPFFFFDDTDINVSYDTPSLLYPPHT